MDFSLLLPKNTVGFRISKLQGLLAILAGSALLTPGIVQAQSSTWSNSAGGAWSVGANWFSGTAADGSGNTADFNNLNITADTTVALDASRTIGNLIFGDITTASHGWIVSNNGSAANVLTLAGATPTITVNALGSGKNANIAAEIAGTQGLTKAGAGTLALTATNSYTGTTTISTGLLQIGNGGTVGSIGSSPIVTNATGAGQGLGVNRSDTYTLDNAISGAGRVNQNGSGTLVISNTTNSFTGVLGLNAGTVRGSDATVFTAASSTTTVLGVGNTIGFSNNTTLQLRANGLNDSSAQTISFRNTLLLSAGSNVITIDVDRQGATGGTGKNLGVTGGTTISSNSTLNVTGGNGFNLSLPNLTAGTGALAGTVTLNPTTANLILGNVGNATGTDHSLILSGTSAGNRITGVVSNAANVLSVTKSGSSTWTMSGTNTYTGATSVTAGSLVVSGNGSINATSGISITGGTLVYSSSGSALNRNVTLNGGTFRQNSSLNYTGVLTFTSGTVGGSNFAGNALSIGANQVIAPGNSTGTMTSGAQTWAALGTYAWEINDATGTAGSTTAGWDLLSITGGVNLTATSGSKFNINVLSLTSLQTPGDAQNFNSATSYNWLIADTDSAITTFDALAFNISTSGFSNAFTGTWSVVRGDSVGGDNTQIYLRYNAIPEPSVLGLLAFGSAILMARRRRG